MRDDGVSSADRLEETRRRLASVPDPLGLLAGLFAHSPVAFQVYSSDGRSVLVNDAFRDLFGTIPPPEYNVLRDEIAERNGVLGLIHRAFAGETISLPPIWYDARELKQVEIKEGRRVGMKSVFFPIHDSAGAVAYVALAFADVTAEMEKREVTEREGESSRRGEQRMGFLAAVSARLGEALSQDAALEALAKTTVPAFADACTISLAGEDGSLRRVAEVGKDKDTERGLRALRDIPAPRAITDAFRTREVQHHPDYMRAIEMQLGSDHEYTRAIRPIAPRSLIVAPILARGKRVGVITVGMTGPPGREFDADDVALAGELGQRAGMAIENARLFAEAQEARKAAEDGLVHRDTLLAREQRRTRQLRGLSEASLDIASSAGVDATLQAITGRARDIVGAHQAITTMLVEGSWGKALSAVSQSEDCRGTLAAPASAGSGIAALVCESNRPIRLTQAELKVHPRGLGGPSTDGLRGWMAAPLVSRAGQNIGLIELSGKYLGDFSPTDEDILVQLAQMASVAIENAMLVDELRRQTQRAEDLGRAKDEFLAMLGHELRNPLAPIVTALQILRLRKPAEVPREQEVIERQVRHLVRLVDDLLDVSRITRGGVELKKTRVEMAPIVARSVELASPILEQKSHTLEVEVPLEGLVVQGDEERLIQVVANLISNAAKYTEAEGHIRVSAARVEAEVELRVRDDGMGIPADLLRFVFEPFVQGGRALDRSQGGLGLGLTIVRSIVQAHGGTVSAESGGPGMGSEFVVRLPVAAGEMSVDVPAPPDIPQVAPRPGQRVLIVDDNVDAADLLAQALARAGYEVRVAADSVDALEIAREFAPAAGLLDIGLPVMDGYELARRLREEHGAILLVAVTGYGQAADRLRAQEAGFDEHVVKPVALEALLRLLAAHQAAPRPSP